MSYTSCKTNQVLFISVTKMDERNDSGIARKIVRKEWLHVTLQINVSLLSCNELNTDDCTECP